MTTEQIATLPFRDFLRRLGLSQSECSRRFGIPLRTVQGWASISTGAFRECPYYVRQMMAEIMGEYSYTITNSEGYQFNLDQWPAIVNLMDGNLMEEVSCRMAPCSEQEFFDAYAAAHLEKFGEQWELDKANPVW